MTHYVHHVPGRLRVKTPALKRQEHRACEVKTYLESIEGVFDVEVSTVTGSVLIKYDAARVNPAVLLNSMRDLGLVHHDHVTGNHTGAVSTGSPLANSAANTFLNKLLETAIEKSAVALIAAVI
jgi:copper chaperone CopZ